MEKKLQKICYILQFLDIAKFMAISSSNLVNNSFEGIDRIKCKYRHDDKKCETCGMWNVESNIRIATIFLNIQTLKMI